MIVLSLAALPASRTGALAGAGAFEGYKIGLDDVPADLLTLAVRRALKEVDRKFRPSPNELRALIIDELTVRKGRLDALRQCAKNAHMLLAPPPPVDHEAEAAERAAIVAGMEKLLRNSRAEERRTAKPVDIDQKQVENWKNQNFVNNMLGQPQVSLEDYQAAGKARIFRLSKPGMSVERQARRYRAHVRLKGWGKA